MRVLGSAFHVAPHRRCWAAAFDPLHWAGPALATALYRIILPVPGQRCSVCCCCLHPPSCASQEGTAWRGLFFLPAPCTPSLRWGKGCPSFSSPSFHVENAFPQLVLCWISVLLPKGRATQPVPELQGILRKKGCIFFLLFYSFPLNKQTRQIQGEKTAD